MDEWLENHYLKLYSTSLLSKGGFWDGDQFMEFICDNDYYVRWSSQKTSYHDALLIRLVEKYLIPALSVPIRIQYFPTPHNGVRVHDEDYEELATQPEVVITLTEEQLRETCEEVKQEYLNETSTNN